MNGMTYEQQLNSNLRWALQEGSMHFEKESAVHKTLRKITSKLDELGIPYALAGAMAMFFHGYRRFTEDVDILVTRDGLRKIHEHLDGLGYVPPFTGSKQLRDTEHGVRVEFLVAGDFPGDGKPKPVAFPDPAEASMVLDGVRCLQLAKLIELKLASGMTNPRRIKDLGDAQELIAFFGLEGDFAQQLDPSVREEYRRLWQAIQDFPAEP
jgi:hypothetical protein